MLSVTYRSRDLFFKASMSLLCEVFCEPRGVLKGICIYLPHIASLSGLHYQVSFNVLNSVVKVAQLIAAYSLWQFVNEEKIVSERADLAFVPAHTRKFSQ